MNSVSTINSLSGLLLLTAMILLVFSSVFTMQDAGGYTENLTRMYRIRVNRLKNQTVIGLSFSLDSSYNKKDWLSHDLYLIVGGGRLYSPRHP